jgi:acyl-[acyl carrier protein]--UDP-N-acetylglucosamine O-acyltransferase
VNTKKMETLSKFCEIDPRATIASNVEIGSFSFIAGDVEIGEGYMDRPKRNNIRWC